MRTERIAPSRGIPTLLFASTLLLLVALTCASPLDRPTAAVPTPTATPSPTAPTSGGFDRSEPTGPGSAPFAYTWRDDFDHDWLRGLWSWVREDAAHWSLSARPGFLRLVTQEGDIYSTRNDQNNLLLSPAPSGDMTVTVKVQIYPRYNFQHAGLAIYQDDDNYVLINRGFVTGGKVNFDLEVGGQPSNKRVVCGNEIVWLRIARQGTTYRGFYSLDGQAWTTVGAYSTLLQSPFIVLLAANTNSGLPQIPADFDYVELEAAVPGFERCFRDDFAEAELGAEWAWVGGQPPPWSLTEQPGQLRLTTASGDAWDAPVLVIQAPAANWLMETRLTFQPQSNFQSAGLTARQDASHILTFGRGYCDYGPPGCLGDELFFDRIEDATFIGDNGALEAEWTDGLFLRLACLDGTCTSFYSLNGLTWQRQGMHWPQFTLLDVGLFAGGHRTGALPRADFDHFLLCANEWASVATPTPTATASPTSGPSPTGTLAPTATGTGITSLSRLLLPVLVRGWATGA